jgi:hypothetical protein
MEASPSDQRKPRARRSRSLDTIEAVLKYGMLGAAAQIPVLFLSQMEDLGLEQYMNQALEAVGRLPAGVTVPVYVGATLALGMVAERLINRGFAYVDRLDRESRIKAEQQAYTIFGAGDEF